jgi:hypothetical protein
VTQLDELAAYTLAWLPIPLVVEAAVDRVAVALVPNGHLAAVPELDVFRLDAILSSARS